MVTGKSITNAERSSQHWRGSVFAGYNSPLFHWIIKWRNHGM